MSKVKDLKDVSPPTGGSRLRRRGFTRLSSKHQATIPVDALREAGVAPGDELRVRADGPGRIVLERERGSIDDLAGSLVGAFPPGFLEELRSEWERPSSTPAS
jgi:bifunctional DNA-binding transcriptional regulator/antitoxin component of YhaV-PrlF toxin-antitoxin module